MLNCCAYYMCRDPFDTKDKDKVENLESYLSLGLLIIITFGIFIALYIFKMLHKH